MSKDISNGTVVAPTKIHSGDEWPPLHLAAKAGDLAQCETLLLSGADPNMRGVRLIQDGPLYRDWYWEPGTTPLIMAAARGSDPVARLLLDSGASARIADQHAWGPLHAAISAGASSIVRMLIAAGADLSLHCWMRHFDEELGWFFVGAPLHLAALRNDTTAAEMLLDAGADLTNCWVDLVPP